MFLEMIGVRSNFKEQYGGKTFEELDYLPEDMDHSPPKKYQKETQAKYLGSKEQVTLLKRLTEKVLKHEEDIREKDEYLQSQNNEMMKMMENINNLQASKKSGNEDENRKSNIKDDDDGSSLSNIVVAFV